MYGLRRITGPDDEPVTADEAKAHCRFQLDAEDDLFTGWIKAARELIELRINRSLLTQSWRLTLDGFPGEIKLPYSPVSAIEELSYLDVAGDSQVLDDELYELNTEAEPAILKPAYNASWPATRGHLGDVTIEYTAGYGEDPTDVPETLRLAIKIAVADWHNNREQPGDLSEGVQRMIEAYWLPWPAKLGERCP